MFKFGHVAARRALTAAGTRNHVLVRQGMWWKRGALPSLSILQHHRFFSTDKDDRGMVLGMLRETYNPWERRAPLTPDHVRDLLQRLTPSLLSNIVVQPASQRIFTDTQYESAGAVLQEDLSEADLILGVKRPIDTDGLLPDKAYMFFSHVIKGQAENLPLLQYLMDNNIQLFDYECIVEGGMERTVSSKERKQKRLVAFGKYAGIAGMVNTFQALGRRLLAECYATPFLNCPAAYMHYDLKEARNSVSQMGTHITHDGGLPPDLEPLIFGFTGKGGNVTSGALGMFKLLPHEMISSGDLEEVRAQTGPQKRVYGLVLEQDDMVRHKVEPDKPFDKRHYRENPNEYEGIFHEKIAPHINVLVNCMYWDERYPRLLTKEQLRDLYNKGNRRLYVVGDISCDVKGSIEFLERTTTIERPYFQYDPILQETSEDLSANGVTVMGLDILPTELPHESSTHFGNALVPLLEKLICSTANANAQGTPSFQKDPCVLPRELSNACITLNGELTPNFKYIEALMNRPHLTQTEVSADSSLLIWLEGHLFDSGLINQVLDVIENHECDFEFLECHLAPKIDVATNKSTALVRVVANDKAKLETVGKKVEALVDLIEKAQATVKCYNRSGQDGIKDSEARRSKITVESEEEETVLLLGSGRVSKSLAEYLGRLPRRNIVVVGAIDEEAKLVAAEAKRGHHVTLDVASDRERLKKLIGNANVVVSLLPATMHPIVAEDCIEQKTDLVTASYESEEMRALGDRARDAGIAILNEVGLDPGLDHMSAMKIIDSVHERGGTVTSFSSVCGGLPSPEAANNPLMYKFSWSPMGVLSASQNSAIYRIDDKIETVDGKNLLSSAQPFDEAWPTLHLECLPNRNSLVYGDKYGIQSASTLFRGTLRYHGFSSVMQVFKNMGLFEKRSAGDATTWREFMSSLQAENGPFTSMDDFILACAGGDVKKAKRASDCLSWLGMNGNGTAPLAHPNSVIESFCQVLEDKLGFEEHERDMVLMHNAIHASFEDGSYEKHQSSFQIYGDENMTAMCKTVGYTCAAATNLILGNKDTDQKGLLLPTRKDIYLPTLAALEHEGIAFVENVAMEPPSAEHAY